MALEVVLEATRALLWIRTPADARAVTTDVVRALGGEVVPADADHADALPVDVSFGDGEPVVPRAGRATEARMLLERHLPSLVGDVRRALELGAQVDRLAEAASIDSLTGLPNRRMLGRALGRLQAGDVVIMLDLDNFKQVNDTLGHDAGDQVLRTMGRTLRATVRVRDDVGRYGGEEFVVILRGGDGAEPFLQRLRRAWEESRPNRVTFSAGVARVGALATSTLPAADRAVYRAKAAGRDRWTWAAAEDYPSEAQASSTDDPGSSARRLHRIRPFSR